MYSDIAIGLSKLFGYKISKNFNLTYFSRDIAEFWRKWHISLTSWFKDYVFIPLEGNKISTLLNIRNIGIVFIISGLWHNANTTFLLCGFYQTIRL